MGNQREYERIRSLHCTTICLQSYLKLRRSTKRWSLTINSKSGNYKKRTKHLNKLSMSWHPQKSTVQTLANTVQELRNNINSLSKQIDVLKDKNNQLQNRTTVQYLSSSLQGWMT